MYIIELQNIYELLMVYYKINIIKWVFGQKLKEFSEELVED